MLTSLMVLVVIYVTPWFLPLQLDTLFYFTGVSESNTSWDVLGSESTKEMQGISRTFGISHGATSTFTYHT